MIIIMDILHEKPMVEIEKEHVLFIDSRYASYSKNQSNVDFSVIFNQATNSMSSMTPNVFKNVKSVELTGISFPSQYANTTGEHCMVLDIEELNDRLYSNIPHANQCFAMIYTPTSSNNTISLVKGQDFEGPKVKIFNPPLSSLNRLTIKLINSFEKKLIDDYGHTTMLFKIKTVQYMA